MINKLLPYLFCILLLFSYAQSQSLNDFKRKLNNAKRNAQQTANQYKKKATQEYNRARQKTQRSYEKSKQYSKNVSKKYVQEIKDNPSIVFEYKKKADRTVARGTANILSEIPVYNPYKGRKTTMNQMCRDYLHDMGGDYINGSELERDPVGTSLMIMMDEEYLLEAKLIETSGGNWISVNDALDRNFQLDEMYEIKNIHSRMQTAYRNENSYDFEDNFRQFSANVKLVNNSSNRSNNTSYSSNADNLVEYFEKIYEVIDDFWYEADIDGVDSEVATVATFSVAGLFSLIILMKIIKAIFIR